VTARKQTTRSRTGPKKTAGIEWVAGTVAIPVYVTGEGEPYRPEALFWMGADGAILGSTVAKPGELLPMASESLQSAIEQPMYGKPHSPTRVRVASAELADALRAGHPGLDVVCAPTPELDEMLALMREKMAEDGATEQSYLSPEIEPEAMAAFFTAAAALFRAKPWKLVPDDQCLFSVTIEQLGVRDAAMSVIGQIGQSLDGRICTDSGASHYVNGHAGLVHLHRLRALVDCVLVGVGTVVADRPRLTVRHVPGPDPVRAVLDPRGRAPADVSPLAPEADAAPTLHLVGAARIDQLDAPAAHVRRVPLPESDGRQAGNAGVAPGEVLAALADAGFRRVLVEGGSNTLSRFFDAGALGRLHVLVAPLLIGSGRPGLELAPVLHLRDAARPPMHRYLLDEDTLFDIEL